MPGAGANDPSPPSMGVPHDAGAPSDGGACTDGGSPPCTCDPTATIGRVIRGNPYVPRNAKTADGMPDSVPPTKTYEVDVAISNWGAHCAGKQITLTIANSGGDNGTATISPTQLSGNGTFKVTVTGGNQTKPGNGGTLKIHAELDGAVKAESAGFTVCAHPINYRDTATAATDDIDTAGAVGIMVHDDWDSDSGTFSDLSATKISEVVQMGPVTSPPFASAAAAPLNTSPYLAGDQKSTDQHREPRPARGPAATLEQNQLCKFKCNRCGVTDKTHPNSGFQIKHIVFQVGAQWKHKTTKVGHKATLGANTAEAGTANITSLDHNL